MANKGNFDIGRFSDPSLFVLASLADGEKHGYAMMADIETMSGVRLGPGTLYGAIARLERRGMIEVVPTEDRRKPYRLTAAGASALQEQLLSLRNVVQTGLKRLATA